jgi:hypothetical protein
VGSFFCLSESKKITKFYIFFVDFGGAGMVFLYNGMVAKKKFLGHIPIIRYNITEISQKSKNLDRKNQFFLDTVLQAFLT